MVAGVRRARRHQARIGQGPALRGPGLRGLRDYFADRLEPVVAEVLADARAAGEIDSDLDALDLLDAVALLCQPVPAAGYGFDYNRRMVMVFIEGLRRHAD